MKALNRNIDISIIIPIFNVEKYLRDCIDSLLRSKTRAVYEILLINDGSTDSSGQIADEYAAKFRNIHVYHYDNHGVSFARNQGIHNAEGKYICFIDSDDMVAPDYLEKLYTQAEESHSDVVWTSFTFVDQEGHEKFQYQRGWLDTSVVSGVDVLHKRYDTEDKHNEIWCAIYNREFLVRNQLFFKEELFIYEDVFYTNQMLLCAERVSGIKEYGYFYRTRENSLVHGEPAMRDIQACLTAFPYYVNLYKTLDEEKKRALGRGLYELISMLLYYIGEAKPQNKKEYYRQIQTDEIFGILKASICSRKERIKYYIFRYMIGIYYPLVKK